MQRLIPIIIHDDASAKKYKDYLKAELLKHQAYTLNDTKELIIAFHSMMVVVYRMPPKGKSMEEWMKKYHKHKLTRYIVAPNNLCFWTCLALWKNAGAGSNCTLIADAKKIMAEYHGKYNTKYS
jgi:hypothetical protein